MFQFWLLGMIGSVIILTLGRLVSNQLTRKEEYVSYKALTVLFSGGFVQLMIIVTISFILK